MQDIQQTVFCVMILNRINSNTFFYDVIIGNNSASFFSKLILSKFMILGISFFSIDTIERAVSHWWQMRGCSLFLMFFNLRRVIMLMLLEVLEEFIGGHNSRLNI